LPCPLLYPAYLYAFARGSPVAGVVTLAVLGLGTFPTLFAYGTVVNSVGATNRERLHRALGVAFLLLGLMPIAHSLSLFGIAIPHVEPPIYQPLG
jgi:sulfite exporter TauE/SafE